MVALAPFLLAVGHDFYANFLASPEQQHRLEAFQIDPKSYQNSDFGYIVMKYLPNQYWAARGMFSSEDWEKWVDPVLRLYTFVVALIPAALCLIWIFVSMIVDAATASGFNLSSPRARADSAPAQAGKKGTTFKYKRR